MGTIVTDTTHARWAAIDSAFTSRIDQAGADRRWLLIQTLATAGSRRALLSSLPIAPGWLVADVGCGFGATTLELAALGPAVVVGVDVDRPVLQIGSEVVGSLEGQVGNAVLAESDAYHLPFPDGALDAVFSRFVFQHLADPQAAAEEIRRALRPGGLVCVVDVDDGLSISEPPPSVAYERLAEALRSSQKASGGDRYIGRRLPALFDRVGLTPVNVLVLPQAGYRISQPSDPERALLLERLRAARDRILETGAMKREEFEADLAAVAAEAIGSTFEVEAHLAVLASKR